MTRVQIKPPLIELCFELIVKVELKFDPLRHSDLIECLIDLSRVSL